MRFCMITTRACTPHPYNQELGYFLPYKKSPQVNREVIPYSQHSKHKLTLFELLEADTIHKRIHIYVVNMF